MILVSSEDYAKAKELLTYMQREYYFVPALKEKLLELEKLLHPCTDDRPATEKTS